jgi:chorismate mutase
MLEALIEVNDIKEDDVASILFTTTPDLTACYPAKAAREMGWHQVALMGFQEIDVPDGLKCCIRVLIHWNTTKRIDEIEHLFMREAGVLRPDLASQQHSVED